MPGKTAKQQTMVVGAAALIALNAQSGAVPDWIMLIPAGDNGVVSTVDGRGPFKISNPNELANVSMSSSIGGRLVVDENHSTDLAAPVGGSAPARGWITALEARDDGIWGKVDWTDAGKALLADRSYRFISPVFYGDKNDNVTKILRASLTNTPNLRGMASLHSQENEMDLLEQLRKLLGLADDADAEAVIAKVKSLSGDQVTTAAALAPIAKAAGLKDGADGAAIVTAVTQLKSGTALQSIAKAAGLKDDADAASIVTAVTTLAAGKGETIVALQSELTAVTKRLNDHVGSAAKEKAVAFVDGAIREGRVGVKPMRDHYITRHSSSATAAADVEKEIAALPKLSGSNIVDAVQPQIKDGKIALSSEQIATANLLGIKPDDFAKTLAAELATSAT